MVPHEFPKDEAFVGLPDRPFKKLGVVRTKVNYPSLDPNHEEQVLCNNYFNKAATNLVRAAKRKGGDAVIDVRSVVFLMNGRTELYSKAECSDDGAEGQVLAAGMAVKWVSKEEAEKARKLEEAEKRKKAEAAKKAGQPIPLPSPRLDPATINGEFRPEGE